MHERARPPSPPPPPPVAGGNVGRGGGENRGEEGVGGTRVYFQGTSGPGQLDREQSVGLPPLAGEGSPPGWETGTFCLFCLCVLCSLALS